MMLECLESWSKVIGLFLTISPFLPPLSHTMFGQCVQSPLKQHCMGGGGGGGGREGPSLVKRAAFIIEQGAIMKTANFQGVPYTFDQDCSCNFENTREAPAVWAIWNASMQTLKLILTMFKKGNLLNLHTLTRPVHAPCSHNTLWHGVHITGTAYHKIQFLEHCSVCTLACKHILTNTWNSHARTAFSAIWKASSIVSPTTTMPWFLKIITCRGELVSWLLILWR